MSADRSFFRALRIRGARALATPHWRSRAGLAILVLAVAQAALSLQEPTQLVAVALLTLTMIVAGVALARRPGAVPIWVLGGASSVLMLVLPGTGAVIGTISAIVNAGLRLPAQSGAVAALAIGVAFLFADGSVSHWSAPVNLGFTAMGLGFAYIASLSVRRMREQRERAEALLVELQQTRDAQVEAAALGERARIAREIHDVLAHTLSALAVQLEGTRLLLEQRPGDPAAITAVERAHRLARDGLDETRRAVGALRGDRLPGPDGLARLVQAESGLQAHYRVEGEPLPLAPDAQLAVYRTAQEALTNVRKHAHATSVDVQLRYAENGAELLIDDVAPPSAGDPSHGQRGYGLIGLRERAELLGGSLEAGPTPTGFRVRLWLPTK